jgi:hypothetical protein
VGRHQRGDWSDNSAGRRPRWKGLVAIAVLASMALSLLPIGPESALAQQLLSRIVGEVTAEGGEPIEGITVTARNYNDDVLYSGLTGADGGYALDLTDTSPEGDGYSVEFTDPTGAYAADVFSQVYIQPGYDQLLSVSLQPGVQITGTVVADGGGPLEGVCVRIFPYDTPWVPYDASAACTDANGEFASIGFAPGRYAFFVRAVNLPYFSEYYGNGEPVALEAPTFDLGTIGLEPRIGNTITGTVVSEETGEPLPSCVDYYEYEEGEPTWSTCSATGDFETIPLSPGTRYLYVQPTDGVHVGTYHSVLVEDLPVVTEIVAPLGGTIAGTVSSAAGVPAGAEVQACQLFYSSCRGVGDAVEVDPLTGNFEIAGLDQYPSEVVVRFTAPGYETEFWDGDPSSPDARSVDTALAVAVGPGVDVTGIDAVLEARAEGAIAGTVTIDQPGDEDSNPIENATIHVYLVDTPQVRVASTSTAADGSYRVDGLAPGDYYVEAVAIGYLTERFDDVGLGETLATTVSVAENTTTGPIDLALEPQGVITGVATAEAGAYVSSTDMYCVAATPLAPLTFATRTSCARIGQPYRISKLPSGSYEVQFTSANFRTTPYTDVGGIPTPVTVATPSTTSGIDVTLVQKPVISGTLTGSGGAPIDRGSLGIFRADGSYVNGATSKVDGTYYAIVDPGSYRVYAYGTQAYESEYYDDATTFAAATAVEVDDDNDRAGIDISLRRRPSISGTMTPCGHAYAVTSDTFRYFSGQNTCNGDSGTFEIFVEPGSYLVSFNPYEPAFGREWWDGADQAGATPIVVDYGNDATGLVVTFEELEWIEGTITTPTGDPAVGLSIRAFDAVTGAYGSGASSGEDGTYRLYLRAGSYKVQFGDDSVYSSARYGSEWWNDQADAASADIVVVADGDSATADAVVEPLRSIRGTISWPTSTGWSCAYIEISTAGQTPEVVRQTTACASNGSATYVAYVESGVYRMRVSSDGYEPGWFGGATEDLAATIDVTVGDASGIDAALATAASISGVVTDSAGAPLQGIYVYSLPGYRYAFTAADGSYRITGLPAGSYEIRFNGSNDHLGEWFDDVSDQASATAVVVAPGEQVIGVDASLARAGSISGAVTDAAGAPLQGIYVYRMPSGQGTYTAADGTYRLNGLTAGNYTVRFDDFSGSYLAEWFDDVSEQASATAVVVAEGEAVTNVDASLVTAGSISGVVTDAAGAPLQGIYVSRSPGGEGTYTAADGTYRLNRLMAGSYTVRFDDFSNDYLDQWFDGVAAQASATPVEVVQGQDTPGVGAAMVRGGAISGTVTDDVTGEPISAYVSVYDAASGGWRGASSAGADGTYRVGGLTAGSYVVQVQSNGGDYVTEWFDGSSDWWSATPIEVAALGQEVVGIDVSLARGGAISGTVTDDATGNPINANVTALDAVTGNWRGSAYTDATGAYRIGNLAAGSYVVEFWDGSGDLATEWFDQASDQDSATPVSVVAGQDTGGVDASLGARGTIEVTVTDAAGTPLSGADVVFWRDGSGPGYTSDSQGLARAKVNPGTYTIEVRAPSDLYVSEWWENATNGSDATAVVVNGGETVQLSVELMPTGVISGTLVDPAGDPIPCCDIRAVAFDISGTEVATGYPNAGGEYVIGPLDNGDYRVGFLESSSSPAFRSEYYPDVSSLSDAQIVSVTVGTATARVDATLDRYGWIEGAITTVDGGPLPSGYVYAGGRSQYFSGGTYRIDGLTTGTHVVRFDPFGNDYLTEWYDNTASEADALPVEVTLGQGTSGIDVEFDIAGSITGTVVGAPIVATTTTTTTDTEQTAPSASPAVGVSVWARTTTGYFVAATQTASDGTYELRGLTEGSYTVEFLTNDDFLGEYFDSASGAASAQPIIVGRSETVTGIDASLTPAAKVSGTVTDDAGLPLDGIIATATIGAVTRSATSGADGQYRVSGLPAGDVVVRFRDPARAYLPVWWSGSLTLDPIDGFSAGATRIATSIGEEVSGVDAILERSSSIAGTVTGFDGVAVEGVRVEASGYPIFTGPCGITEIDQVVNPPWNFLSTTSDSTGSYVVSGLRCDDYYTLSVTDFSQEYENASFFFGSLGSDVQVPGTDFQLVPTVKIRGEVRGLSNQRLSGIEVDLYDDNEDVVATVTTNSQGAYQFAVLSGEYRIHFRDPDRIYANEWFDDVAGQGDATPVLAQAGSVKTANATLRYGGTISGVVLDDQGEPADGVRVELRTCSSTSTFCIARSVITGSIGGYQLDGVTPGSYNVRFIDPGTERFVAEYHLDATDYATAMPVEIDVDVVANVDATLTRTAAIQGVVVDSSGNPLDGIVVSGTTPATAITTGADGTFTLRGFRTGTQRLTVSDPTSEFLSEQPEYETTLSELTGPVTVVLYRPSILQGVVTNDLGNPVPDARITIRSSATNAETAVTVDAEGRYAFTNVRSGDYRIRTLDLAGWHFATSYGDPFEVPLETTLDRDLVLEAGGPDRRTGDGRNGGCGFRACTSSR